MKKKLNNIIGDLKIIIDLEKKSGRFKSELRTYLTWVPQNFTYTKNGIESPELTGKYISKKDWFQLMVFATKKIRDQKQWSKLVISFKKKFPSTNVESYLEQFIRHIADKITHRYSEKAINDIVSQFLNDLKQNTTKVEIKVWLEGIILDSYRIKLDKDAVIRRTTSNDIATYLYDEFTGYNSSPPLTTNHAILEIKGKCHYYSTAPIQDKLNLCITAFRLFKMGSVRYSSYEDISKSCLSFRGRMLSGRGIHDVALQKYLLKKTELPRFKVFWKEFNKKIQKLPLGSHSDEITPLKIAYDRYCLALMRNVTKEERISNTIAGLEAALVGGKEELNYRLKLNTAKILVEYGYSFEDVFSLITTGYGIRSKFVHGEKLSRKDIKKIESKYGDLKNLLNKLMECLRIILNVSIFSDLEKEDLITLIEGSFVSQSEYKRLRDTIGPLKRFLM